MQPEKFLEHFSTHLKSAIARGISAASKLESEYVTPMHLLLALCEESGSVAKILLEQNGVDASKLLPLVSANSVAQSGGKSKFGAQTTTLPELDDYAKQALEKAMLAAYEHGQNYIGTEHLLFGILELPDPFLDDAFSYIGVNPNMLGEALDNVLHRTTPAPDVEEIKKVIIEFQDNTKNQSSKNEISAPKTNDVEQNPAHAKSADQKHTAPPRQPTALDVFTTDLTSKHAQSNLDPVIGRDDEISRLIRILARRTKNNPVLVGEPGVGKTALVEGLAKKIASGDVPDILKRKKIRALDLTLLLAGTMYRGEFEARLKQLIEEIIGRNDTILFIDEIHNIIGAGSNSGTMDAANILKPALARGLLHCIGATTLDEYQKHIASDPALERRFQSVTVEEPNRAHALQMLLGIKKYYEDFHSVTIENEAVEAAVDLSIRYVHDNFLPDKAIDLIDEAAAAIKIEQPKSPYEDRRQKLLANIEEARIQKANTISNEALKDAIHWKEKETKLSRQLVTLDKKIKKMRGGKASVNKNTVAKILAHKLHLSPNEIMRSDWEKLEDVAKEIKAAIIGQDAVIDEIVRGLRQAYFRLGNGRKPLASFLFAGPSGVGKTALTRTLAKALYHDEKAFMKFDMTEFAEQHSVSKLLGSPAGYIGYKERNRFTDELKKRPHAVIVFDEYDKAHPDVQKLLFQILDEGELSDSQGKKIHFNHAIIILTTNVGADLYQSNGFGFTVQNEKTKTAGEKNKPAKDINHETKKRISEKLKEHFGASLLGRIGHVLLFRPLDTDDRKQIVENLFSNLSNELLQKQQLSITPDKIVLEDLAAAPINSDTGIRELERKVERLIQDAIVDAMQNSRKKKHYTLTHTDGIYRLE